MTESFVCGDTGALVAYAYEECEPEVRDAIAVHLVECPSCLREVEELAATRRQLSSWEPPPAELGFQMTTPAESRLAWWRSPLPAWAQAAAALLIFGAGLSAGLVRGSAVPDRAAAPAVRSSPAPDLASRQDLAELEQRLRTAVAEVRDAMPAAAPTRVASSEPITDEAIITRVQALIDESEERQRRDFTLRSVELARDFEAQRRLDLASVRETLGQFQGVTGAEIRQQREAIDRINNFIRVSQQGR